jgi:hypothetical protein
VVEVVLVLPESQQPLVLGQIAALQVLQLDMQVAEIVLALMVKEQETAEAPLQTKVLEGLLETLAQYKLLVVLEGLELL